jgi:16S rRNA (cytosine1402-N4)-methyltransferase
LAKELVDALQLQPGQQAVDCTAGYGGHTALMLERVGKNGLVHAIDRDPAAIAYLKQRFANEIASGRLRLHQIPFSQLTTVLADVGEIHGIGADLGVSSPQLDEADRGFSLRMEGPLDMRMDPGLPMTAADIVNNWEPAELTKIFRELGEEPKARFITRAITKVRESSPIETTQQLAKIIENAVFYKTPSRRHPATRCFQALRMVVNEELAEVEALCKKGFALLAPGGRLGIISFHSLEDRIVKKFFKHVSQEPGSDRRLRDLPYIPEEIAKSFPQEGKIIKPFPLKPTESEIANNPRSRSAKLRVIQRTIPRQEGSL